MIDRRDYHEEISHKDIEEGKRVVLDFEKLKKIAAGKEDVLPVVVQDSSTKEVLILAYANKKALEYSLENGVAAFWSTSRNELWVKGATSGDALKLDEIRVNCDQNSLLYLVTPLGRGACHTKNSEGVSRSGCYYRRMKNGQLEEAS